MRMIIYKRWQCWQKKSAKEIQTTPLTFLSCIFERFTFSRVLSDRLVHTVPLQVNNRLGKIQGYTGLNRRFRKVKMEITFCNMFKKSRPKRVVFLGRVALSWWMATSSPCWWLLSSSCSFLLHPKLHIFQSNSFLLSQRQMGHYSWLSQKARSWSWPSRGLAG